LNPQGYFYPPLFESGTLPFGAPLLTNFTLSFFIFSVNQKWQADYIFSLAILEIFNNVPISFLLFRNERRLFAQPVLFYFL